MTAQAPAPTPQLAAAPSGAATPSLDRRVLGRMLTRLANATVEDVLAMAPAHAAGGAPAAARIGLTGPPGVGKSSLGGRLALHRLRSRQVGLLAIDPSSPTSGGAILGDRIRIDDLEGAERLFVRSLASRSASDGLADNLPELLGAMEAAGFDEILLETVGVGQAEHAARHLVDTLLLVLNPESGDMVQAMKAGIMELADLYVINKADLPGAQRIANEITRVLHIVPGGARDGWTPQVLLTSIRDEASIARLSDEIDRHQAWLAASGLAPQRHAARVRYRLRNLLDRCVAERITALPPAFFEQPFEQQFRAVVQALAPPR